MLLQITLADNERSHEDIHVQFNNHQFVCDSYYFLIDDTIPDEPTTAGKAKTGLQILLMQWLESLRVSPDDIIYLPFDFSDQFTRCLRCKIKGTNITVCAGWTHVEGWRTLPSNIAGYSAQVTDFQPETSAIDVQRDVFMHQLTNLINTFQNQKDE